MISTIGFVPKKPRRKHFWCHVPNEVAVAIIDRLAHDRFDACCRCGTDKGDDVEWIHRPLAESDQFWCEFYAIVDRNRVTLIRLAGGKRYMFIRICL